MLKAEGDAYENAIGIVKAGGADEEIYIRAHSDVGRPLTGQSLTGLPGRNEKHCREMGYDARYSEFITEQEYAENAGETLTSTEWDNRNVVENGE